MKITVDVPNDLLARAISTGIGGTFYWCCDTSFAPGASIGRWQFTERDTGITHTVYSGDIARALAAMVTSPKQTVRERAARIMGDRGDRDDGDVLIQLAVFGELKYG